MGLPYDKLEVPLGLGLQTDIDDKLLPIGKVPKLENGIWDRTGEVMKRFGTSFLGGQYAAPTPGNMPPPWQLATHKGALVSLSKAGLRNIGVYSPAMNKWAAAPGTNIEAQTPGVLSRLRGQVLPRRGTVFRSNAVNSSARVNNVAQASNGTYQVVCWIQSNDVALTATAQARIIEVATGKTLFSHADAVTYGSASCRVAFVDSRFQMVVRDGVNIELWIWLVANITAGNGGVTGPISLATDATSSAFDIIADGTDLLVLYAGATTRVLRRTNAGVVTANNLTTAAAGAVTPGQFAWMKDLSGAVRVAAIVASGAQGVNVQWNINLGTGQAGASYTVDAGFGADVAQLAGHTITNNATGEFVVLYYNNAGAGAQRLLWGKRQGGAISTATWIWSACLGSMTWLHGEAFYVEVAYESSDQGTLFTVRVPTVSPTDTTDGTRTPSARAFGGQAGFRDTGPQPDVTALATDVFLTASRLNTRLVTAATALSGFDSGVDSLTLTFNPLNVGVAKEFADSLYVCGGVLGAFDGSTFAEEGFHLYPEPPVLSENGAGLLTTLGRYSVAAVYRYTDDFGRIRRSTDSDPSLISLTGSNGTIRAVIKTLKLHGRPGKVAIEVYITPNNAPEDLRLAAVVANVETVDTVTVDISATEAQIGLGQPLYTSGGTLFNESPPASLAVTPYKDRLAVIDAEDPTRVWVSLPLSEVEGPRFNVESTFRIDDGRGDLVGHAAQDDRLIEFKRDVIYTVPGDGVDAQGNGTFGQPLKIASGVGCIEARSIVETPDGVMFRAATTTGGVFTRAGIFMVNRGLAIDDKIGAPVFEYLESATIVDAVHLPDQMRTKFYTSNGVTLVYDHLTKLWATHAFEGAEAATAWGGRVVRQQTAQVAMVAIADDTTGLVFDDSAAAVAMTIDTPWISIAKLKGYFRFNRVQLVGTKRGTDDELPGYKVSLTVLKDFDDDNPLATVSRDMLLTEDINAVELRYSAKLSAIKVRVTISQRTAGSSNFAGPKLTGLVIYYATKTGLRKTASGNRLT